jgi:translation initiation factor IF-2
VLYADHRRPSPSGNDGLQAPATTRPAASDAGLELAVPADPSQLAVEPPAAAQAPGAGTAAPSADRDQAASTPASPARAAPQAPAPALPPPPPGAAPPLVPLPGEDPGDFADRVQLARDAANDRLDDLRD